MAKNYIPDKKGITLPTMYDGKKGAALGSRHGSLHSTPDETRSTG